VPIAKTHAVSLLGLAGTVVEVEAEISSNLPSFVLVGLPDASLLESKDRVRSALHNSGLKIPGRRVTVNLSPASVPKHGSSFDLSIAIAIAAASGQLKLGDLTNAMFVGELALDGRLMPVSAVLPKVLAAKRSGFSKVCVPARNLTEALLVDSIEVLGFDSLADLVAGKPARQPDANKSNEAAERSGVDLAEVQGQETAIEGLTLAAAGGHHAMFIGSPGAGKTMLAKRLPTILPTLSSEQAIETLALRSLAGQPASHAFSSASDIAIQPPFEAPHHSATEVAIIGGGVGLPRPGLISLAHNGVLFLDEATEFSPRTLDALRQPLESGLVQIHRSAGTAVFPANFQLLLAANPCPCGHRLSKSKRCTCSYAAAQKYLNRLSGPLLDRIDIRLVIQSVSQGQTQNASNRASSSSVRERVTNAREVARSRLRNTPWQLNARVPGTALRKNFQADRSATKQLEKLVESGELSMRAADRCLRVAWTIADLADSGKPNASDVDLALLFRGQDRFGADV